MADLDPDSGAVLAVGQQLQAEGLIVLSNWMVNVFAALAGLAFVAAGALLVIAWRHYRHNKEIPIP